jgi:7,8-dihydropterin-6-yl-methyl-4-(beta-D-ribofuranosyl)aminobenzene 5'-phosphate synthase
LLALLLQLVMGGFHMGGAPRRRIEAVIERFRQLGVAAAAPCHCSGNGTRKLFEEDYGEGYIPASVGTSLRFSPLEDAHGR